MGRIVVNPVMSLKEKESETKNGTQSKDMRRGFLVTLIHLGRIHTRDTGIRFANEGYKRNKEASGAVQTTIPVGDTYEILKSSRSAWSSASILLRIKRLM